MRNIIDEKPSNILNGRLLASAHFVDSNDIIGKNILDIGCGYGWCELNFLKRGAKEITGIEISDEDLQTIRKNVKDERMKLLVCSATDLPFENETFDTVVSWEVIEHIPKRTENKMFSEVNRILKPGGCFYFSTPHASFFSNIMDPAWWMIGHRHYSKKKLIHYAENNKFKILNIEIKGGWWVLFSTLNMYIAKWIFRRKLFFDDECKKRSNIEYKKNNGFMNIFVKLKK